MSFKDELKSAKILRSADSKGARGVNQVEAVVEPEFPLDYFRRKRRALSILCGTMALELLLAIVLKEESEWISIVLYIISLFLFVPIIFYSSLGFEKFDLSIKTRIVITITGGLAGAIYLIGLILLLLGGPWGFVIVTYILQPVQYFALSLSFFTLSYFEITSTNDIIKRIKILLATLTPIIPAILVILFIRIPEFFGSILDETSDWIFFIGMFVFGLISLFNYYTTKMTLNSFNDNK